jgi:dienelactone hydrolase
MPAKDIHGFRQFDFSYASIAKTVYWKAPEGSSIVGKPVLVMHELPGLTEFATRFAQRLVDAGFTVYLPLLFGEPLKRDVWGYSRQLCISQEFARLQAGVSAPITNWLQALARDLSSRHQGARVGAIGMCLTGGFVIPLILEPVVTAPVASQPSVPYSVIYWLTGLGRGPWMRQLNISDADLSAAAQRAQAESLTLLAFRFKDDRICTAGKLERLGEAFGDRLEAYQFDTPKGFRLMPPHAVLTEEYDKAEHAGPTHPTRLATARVIAFLHARLG